MKRFIFIFSLIIFSLTAQADIIEKMQLEDALKQRIESGLKLYDSSAHVNVSVVLKKYPFPPGTSMDENFELNPEQLEESDVISINVSIMSHEPALTPQMSEAINTSIPIKKRKITIDFKNVAKSVSDTPPRIQAKDLSDISNSFIQNISKYLAYGLSGSLFLLVLLAIYLNQRSLKEFKNQFTNLINVLSENNIFNAKNTEDKSQESTETTLKNENALGEKLELTTDGLAELFSDCYWCEEDQYASWLWLNTTQEQKKSLLEKIPFMKEYSHYFINQMARESAYHNHPYYLEPLAFRLVSQEQISQELKKQPGLWASLSPMRQKLLSIPIKDRLRLVNSTSTQFDIKSLKPSTKYRTLEHQADWGTMSLEDEAIIFKDPQMVPPAFRKNIKSLAWLCLHESSFIESTLAQFDARELATAWIAAPEVLQKLEQHLPEKKLKLVKTYCEKVTSSKNSACYQALVKAGQTVVGQKSNVA